MEQSSATYLQGFPKLKKVDVSACPQCREKPMICEIWSPSSLLLISDDFLRIKW